MLLSGRLSRVLLAWPGNVRCLPTGNAGASWLGLTHLTLGYDSSSARNTPSVASALDSYLEQVSRIAGAKAVTSKTLKAYTWSPPQVAAAKTQIIEALEALVTGASGAEPDQPAPGSLS